MASSGFALTPALRAAHATGHTSRGNPRGLSTVSGMHGSGALRSTANDMVRFLQSHLGLRDSPLASALRATQRTEADRQLPDLPMGLGWFHSEFTGTRIVSHGGSTPGFSAYVGMDIESQRGVVVLANSDNDVTNLAKHLIEPQIPLYSPEPPRQFSAIPMGPRILDQYVGDYRVSGAQGDVIRIRREGAQLLLVTRGRTRKMLAESQTTFFAEDMEDWSTFTRDASGRVDGLTWHRENWQQVLKRVR
jgi:CubicO group peptidase (beta-lactamase class C family)